RFSRDWSSDVCSSDLELMNRQGIDICVAHIPDTRDPLETSAPWAVLIELVSGEPGAADRAMERILEDAFERGLIQDAAMAQNERSEERRVGKEERTGA